MGIFVAFHVFLLLISAERWVREHLLQLAGPIYDLLALWADDWDFNSLAGYRLDALGPGRISSPGRIARTHKPSQASLPYRVLLPIKLR